MQTKNFTLSVGAMSVHALYDGSFQIPTENLVANAAPDELQALIQQGRLPQGEYELTMTALLLRQEDVTVLVDAGFGAQAASSGRIVSALQGHGLQATDVDQILLSHGHADHVAGLVSESSGLTFPNADVVIAQDEWDYWQPDAKAEDEDSFRRTSRQALAAVASRVRLFDQRAEVAPGVEARVVPGHTPGHLLVEVESEGERLLLLNDLLLHPLHLERPGLFAAADVDGPQNEQARRTTLAAAEGRLCHAYHFPYPGLGRVRRAGEAWRWEAEAGV